VRHGAPGRERVADSGMGRDESFTCVRHDGGPVSSALWRAVKGDPTPIEGYTATLSLIPSFGA
jgi:hypothetical protein